MAISERNPITTQGNIYWITKLIDLNRLKRFDRMVLDNKLKPNTLAHMK